jgi:AcrR family transcriptional regulator
MPRTIADRGDIIPVLADVFRQYGYEGASLSVISAHTGLGKGSLYHFFPGGKEEMASAVLANIDAWFRTQVFEPLARGGDTEAGIRNMIGSVDAYFRGGGRVCVVGVFALGDVRDRFADAVRGYFDDWITALAAALKRRGAGKAAAHPLAEEVIAGIQGALVLARARHDPASFRRALQRHQARLLACPRDR